MSPDELTRRSNAEATGVALLRAAECLTALLQGPTTRAGLNEARFNVLAAVSSSPGGKCSQAELATRLLQSESNLSTLLERMHKDGLISRERSATDRRKVVIGLTVQGAELLGRAGKVRTRTMSVLLRDIDGRYEGTIESALEQLVCCLQRELGLDHETGKRTRVDNTEEGPHRYTSVPSVGDREWEAA